jgi:hypothetical protein
MTETAVASLAARGGLEPVANGFGVVEATERLYRTLFTATIASTSSCR